MLDQLGLSVPMEEAAVARANVVSAAVRWCEQRGRTVRLHELVQGVGERAGALPLEVSERTRCVWSAKCSSALFLRISFRMIDHLAVSNELCVTVDGSVLTLLANA